MASVVLMSKPDFELYHTVDALRKAVAGLAQRVGKHVETDSCQHIAPKCFPVPIVVQNPDIIRVEEVQLDGTESEALPLQVGRSVFCYCFPALLVPAAFQTLALSHRS